MGGKWTCSKKCRQTNVSRIVFTRGRFALFGTFRGVALGILVPILSRGLPVPDEAGQADPERLLGQARRGEDQALGELLEFYRPYLSLLARLKSDRQLQAKLDHSDLVQDTCLAAHRDFAQFLGTTEPEFTAWLREIMAHTAANLIRDHRRQRRDVRIERQLYNLRTLDLGRWLSALFLCVSSCLRGYCAD